MKYLIFSILFILLAITPTTGLLPYESLFDNQYGVWGYLLLGITLLVGGLFDHFPLKKLLRSQAGNKMSEIFEEIVGLDKIIHKPARLAILTALSSCISADFTFLQNLTGLTQGNLSGHLIRLEEAKLIEIEKKIIKKRPNTTVKLTPFGKKSIDAYWKQLEELREKSKSWKFEDQ